MDRRRFLLGAGSLPLFPAVIVHHGVGSEGWSADGFTRLAAG
jgi:hypothetical protein